MRRFPHLLGLHSRGGSLARAGTPRGAAGCALAGHRPRLRAAHGARPAPVPHRAADRRAGRPGRGQPVVDLLLGPPGERGLPHRRARAGALVRRRHRPEGDQVRARAVQRRGHPGHAPAAGFRRYAAAPDPRRPRLRALGPQGGRRDDRPARRAGPVAGRGARPRRGRARRALRVLRAVGRQGLPRRRSPATGSRWLHASPSSPSSSRWRTANDGIDGALDLARRRSGTQFDPALVEVVLADAEKVFQGLDETDSWDAVIDGEPALAHLLSQAECDEALAAIGGTSTSSRPTPRATRRRSPAWRRPRPPASACRSRTSSFCGGPAWCRGSAGSGCPTRSGTRPDP